jgi:hypothetical protein
MPAVAVTNSATATVGAAPHATAARITTLFAKPVETLTLAELKQLLDAARRTGKGSRPGATLLSIFTA